MAEPKKIRDPSPISKRMKVMSPEVCQTIEIDDKSYHILVKVCAFKKNPQDSENEQAPPGCCKKHNWTKVLPSYMRDNGECSFVCQDCGHASA